jgi:hypothetical protein
VVLFSTVNICFGRSLVGSGEGGRFGVGVGRSSGVRDIVGSVAVGSGDGLFTIVGAGVGDGSLELMSVPPREINHAASTPETASTTTIANIHGKALLRDSPPRSFAGAPL